jgi:putative transposase
MVVGHMKKDVNNKKQPEKKKSKKKKGSEQTLSYPLPIRCAQKAKIIETLNLTQSATNKYLWQGYEEEILNELQEKRKKAYKILEPLIGKSLPGEKLPSRINRGTLEIAGRILRTVNNRKILFDALMKLDRDPETWNYKRLIDEQQLFIKSQYIQNIKEQTLNFVDKNLCLPDDFFELQENAPRLYKPIFSYAPDDGQAIKINPVGDKLEIEMKIFADKWQWIKISLPLPQHLQGKTFCAPDLRMACIHGKWLPVLDYKILEPIEKKQKGKYFLTVDWGTRKLLTVCIFDYNGNQISTPIFLKFDPLRNKLLRIRKLIDRLKSIRDRLSIHNPRWTKYNRIIAQLWRKYRAINKNLSHLAANFITLIAKIYECDIYVEWLKGLKSTDKGPDLNWIINTTIRQAIYDKVQYKATLLGLTFHKPIPPAYTSSFCPRCGEKGHHVVAPNNPKKKKSGSWFVCPQCKFNADRDYVACCNLARKVLYGNSLVNLSKAVIYKKSAIPDLPIRQGNSLHGERLRRCLNGWKKSVFIRHCFFSGTLRN